MRATTKLNGKITRLAVGQHLPRRAVRVRLTLLYGALFLVTGAALLAITFVLVDNDTGVVLTQGGNTAQFDNGHLIDLSHRVTPKDMRGNQLVGPTRAEARSQWLAAQRLAGQSESQHRHILEQLGIESGIALAVMSVLSLGLGWLMAGRVLQPLEDSYEAQRQFVANASHELRSPLARQRALIQVALADPRADFSSLRRAHERVLASEQHLEQMIDALLSLTRGQAGLERRERIDLAAVASEVVLTREAELAEAGLELKVSIQTAPALGDPRLVERLIANLVDNAILHNFPGGHVEIDTRSGDRRAIVAVTNSGPSVPPAEIERLFEPFQRLGGSRTAQGGHGLGLSIVQAIATAHHAELSASARPEGGLAIEVAFPAPSRAAAPVAFATAWLKRARPRPALHKR